MADYTAARSEHKTLTGTTADRVMLTAIGIMEVVIVNTSATTSLYANVGLSNATGSFGGSNLPATPTAGADDTLCVPPNTARLVSLESLRADGREFFGMRDSTEPIVVAVVGNGNGYSVEGQWKF